MQDLQGLFCFVLAVLSYCRWCLLLDVSEYMIMYACIGLQLILHLLCCVYTLSWYNILPCLYTICVCVCVCVCVCLCLCVCYLLIILHGSKNTVPLPLHTHAGDEAIHKEQAR